MSYFRDDTSQQQISEELNQIRTAIYRDVVPQFVGLDLKDRDFYLSQNTETLKTLYDLNEDAICWIIDGGYQRCQKSQNNEFQYTTFSAQKGQNLFHPCLIVTPTGFIVDCFVNFEANKNDAEILREIINKDQRFMNILKPNDFLFLDRYKFKIIFIICLIIKK